MRNIAERDKLCLYIAGPLFSEAEREYNIQLKRVLAPYFDVYLPQEDGGLLVEMVKNGMLPEVAARKVFKSDIDALERCSVLLIILDGRTIDEGAAVELGYAYAKGKVCFGFKTGPRQLLPFGNNPMVDGSLIKTFSSIDELVAWASVHVSEVRHDERSVPVLG